MKRVHFLLQGSLLICGASCRSSKINGSATVVAFTCPSQPNAIAAQGQEVTLDFGNVAIGQTDTLPVDVASLNGASVTISAVDVLQANPTLTFPLQAGVTVQPAPPTVVQAAFSPTQSGPQSASWKIELGSSPAITLTLKGKGFPVNLTVDPDPVDFGDVEIHASVSKQVTVTNSSSQPVALGLVPPDGGPFTVAAPNNSSLAVGASLTLSVSYSPTLVETDSASFILTGCAGCSPGLPSSPGSGDVQVPLKGIGVASDISFPNPLQFGFVTPQSSVQKTLALKNVSGSALQISSQPVLYPGSFGPPPGQPPIYAFATGSPSVSYPHTLNSGEELDLPITFTPSQIGAYLDGTVTFQSSDTNLPQGVVRLNGYGGGAQISCQPQSLDLGPVALGYSSSQPLVCLNVGTDVPGHLEAALQLDQSLLSTTNPNFQAILLSNSDGGTSVSLAAGQSATIQVTFSPPGDAGVETGTLQIGSNDLAHDPVSVPLTGRGVVPGPCAATVLPSGGLNFGEVLKGSSAVLQFAVENQGNNYCIVKDMVMGAGSDPAFSLPNGPIPYQLVSFPGDPYNTSNLPTELRIPVQFAPTQDETTAQGSVAFQITNGNPVAQTVPLTGSSAPACLTFVPDQLNFGLVGLNPATQSLCFNPHQTVAIQNSCSTPVTLQSIALATDLDNPAQFALSGLPTLPLTLAANKQVNLTATFQGTEIGQQAETLQVTTDEFPNPYSLSLTGDVEASGTRTDSFVVPQKQLDLVLVLDTDDDGYFYDPRTLGTESQQFTNQLTEFVAEANAEKLDYRIAVVTTAICSKGDKGWFSPCSTCMVDTTPNAVYITPQSTPDPTTVLTQLVSAIWSVSNDQTCPFWVFPADEQFFEIPFLALGPTLLAGHNAGFLRDSAYLAMLTVNTDNEDDNTELAPSRVAGFLQNLKPEDPTLISWSYVNYGLGKDPTAHVSELANATGGILIDMSITGWEVQLLNLFSSTIGAGVFRLGAQPNLTSIQVTLDGAPVAQLNAVGSANWSYDPARNAVVFSPGQIPLPESLVVVTYSVVCS